MKRAGVVLTLSLAIAAPAAAQDSTAAHPACPMMGGMMGCGMMGGGMMGMMMADTGPVTPKFAWYLAVGGGGASWGDVATAFTSAGYDAPVDNNVQVGFGMYGVHRRFLLGGEGYGYTGQSHTSPNGRDVRAGGGAAFFNLGYTVVERPKLRAYPFVGLGFVSTVFQVDQATGTGLGPQNNSPTFAQVLQSPGRHSTLSATGLALEVGGGFDFVPFMRHTRKGMYGLLLGIRAGYQYVPLRSDWKLYNQVTVQGGPDQIANGFFVRVSIGGAGRKGHAGMAGGCPMMGQCPMMQGHGQ